MSDDSVRQRLAAILAADAVGYSRLMEADERTTVAALDAARDIFKKEIESNHGHVINMAGDSVLAVFDTAAGAVTAALAVQRTLDASSRDVPDDRRMRFRIGMHLGDVIEKADGDLYGDGVNIAARLQALAEPGGIIVSEAVRGAVKSRVAATFDDRGMQAVKNIADPVRAFAVRPEGAPPSPVPPDRRAAPADRVGRSALALRRRGAAVRHRHDRVAAAVAERSSGRCTWPGARASAASCRQPSGKPSIAVLPFDNMSGDPSRHTSPTESPRT